MARVQIAGRRRHLDVVLERLYQLRRVQLESVERDARLPVERLEDDGERGRHADELRVLIGQLEGLLALLDPPAVTGPLGDPVAGAVDTAGLRDELRPLEPEIERITARLEALRGEQAVLPRYLTPLRELLPLVPELADLDEQRLAAIGLDTIALVLSTDDPSLVDALRTELADLLGRRFELVAARVEPEVLGCVIVFPHAASEAVHGLLGQEHVRHLPLPEAFAGRSLKAAVSGIARRLDALPGEIGRAQDELERLLRPREERWRRTLAGLLAELEQTEAAALAGATRRAFVVAGWVPRSQLGGLRAELEQAVDGELALEELPTSHRDPATPILLRNTRPARPFQFLIRFLDLPRPGALDPTGLMALFLPLMFGIMVGDVAYGLLLLAIGLWVKRRFGPRSSVVLDLSRVLVVGAGWAIVFGVLFGELLGNLGKELGMPALWFYRPEGLETLLLFALAVGATHIVLGLVLGLWESWRARDRGHLADRGGTLLVLAALFGVAATAAELLPAGVMGPAVAAALVGLALMVVPHGALGLVVGPLELLGTLGNILSYLRLAAVGLASAYLAIVANEFAAVAPLGLGVIVAAFFHTLNLALAGFSPMIQALRLHYVEFFSKFYAAGGRPFRPFGQREATV